MFELPWEISLFVLYLARKLTVVTSDNLYLAAPEMYFESKLRASTSLYCCSPAERTVENLSDQSFVRSAPKTKPLSVAFSGRLTGRKKGGLRKNPTAGVVKSSIVK